MRLLGRVGDLFHNRTFCPHTPGPPAHHPSHSGRQLGYASLNRVCAVGAQLVRQRPRPDTAGALRERRELAMCRPNRRPAGLISRPTPCGMPPRLHARQRARPDRRQAVRRAFGTDFTCIRQEMRHNLVSGRMGHATWGLAHGLLGRSRPASRWTCLQPQRGTEFTRSACGQSSMSAAGCSHSGCCWVCAVGGSRPMPRRGGAQRAAEWMVS